MKRRNFLKGAGALIAGGVLPVDEHQLLAPEPGTTTRRHQLHLVDQGGRRSGGCAQGVVAGILDGAR